MEAGVSPDELTILDENIDNSIGGRGSTLEYVPGTRYAVPLFEFRSTGAPVINTLSTKIDNKIIYGFESFVTEVEEQLESDYEELKEQNPSLVQRRALSSATACTFSATRARNPFGAPNE